MVRKSLSTALAAIALATASTAARAADDQTASPQQLQDEVKQLREAVKELQAQRANPPFTAADVDATVSSVITDASRRSQLLMETGGVTSGFSIQKGFFISNEDQSFYLHPRLVLQFRGVANYREEGKKGDNSTETGFEIRRAKFGFDGNVFSKDISFRLQWQDSNNGGAPTLEYGWAQYVMAHGVMGGDWAVRVGQFKDVVFKEEATVGDEFQLMAERTLANALIGGGATGPLVQGVNFIYTGAQPLHAQFTIHDGVNSGNTDFRDNQPVTTTVAGVSTTTNVATDFCAATRVEYKFFGDWKDNEDFTGVWAKNDLLVIGAGADYTEADHQRAIRYTVDAQYMTAHRFVIFAGLYGDYIDFRNTGGSGSRNDWGGVIEGGYFITPAFQAVARYSITQLDSDFKVGGESTFHEIGAGFNYFLGDHGSLGNRAKITVDLNYLPNGSPGAGGLDYLASPNGADEWVFRAQFQLWL
jgi:hypothetical protein